MLVNAVGGKNLGKGKFSNASLTDLRFAIFNQVSPLGRESRGQPFPVANNAPSTKRKTTRLRRAWDIQVVKRLPERGDVEFAGGQERG